MYDYLDFNEYIIKRTFKMNVTCRINNDTKRAIGYFEQYHIKLNYQFKNSFGNYCNEKITNM